MTTVYNEGDRVQIVERDVTPEDIKSNMFFNHYRGLIGTVQKVYATQEVAIEVELDSLPEAVANRHVDVQEQMKTKWLDGLSEEARNRLTDRERDFRLRYTILVTTKDLTEPTRAIGANTPPNPLAESVARRAALASEDATTPRRLTSEEIDAAEQAELQRRNAGNA